jgi:hypothetical protein
MAVSLIPSGAPVSRVVARRFVLGRQGLWPGRRWAGIDGLRRALRTVECVQMENTRRQRLVDR